MYSPLQRLSPSLISFALESLHIANPTAPADRASSLTVAPHTLSSDPPSHHSNQSVSLSRPSPALTMSTTTPSDSPSAAPSPSIINWTLGFLLVGLAWGLTTPFIRRAAVNFHPAPHSSLSRIDTSTKTGWVKFKIVKGFFTVVDLLRSPSYAVPLVINLTGSVWFFLLIGKAGEWRVVFLGVCGGGWVGWFGGRVLEGEGRMEVWGREGRDGMKSMETGVVCRGH